MAEFHENQKTASLVVNLDDHCQDPLHPRAIIGLELFNRGLYFEAHEELEAAWREERGPVRELYRAILQIGLGYMQIQRGNYAGAVKMFRRCKRWLEPFPDHCRGINLARLRKDYAAVEAVLLRFGPKGIRQFPLVMIKMISFSTAKDQRVVSKKFARINELGVLDQSSINTTRAGAPSDPPSLTGKQNN